MKFDLKYPFGAQPPHCEYRRLVAQLDGHQLNCVKCGDVTNWVCVPLMTATCSDECLVQQVRNHTTPPLQEIKDIDGKVLGHGIISNSGHWLLMEDGHGNSTSNNQPLSGVNTEPGGS